MTTALTVCEQESLWLAEAKAALHALLTVSKVEALTHADKSLRYSAGDIGLLRTYIRGLQAAVDACNGVRRPGSAFRFIPADW